MISGHIRKGEAVVRKQNPPSKFVTITRALTFCQWEGNRNIRKSGTNPGKPRQTLHIPRRSRRLWNRLYGHIRNAYNKAGEVNEKHSRLKVTLEQITKPEEEKTVTTTENARARESEQ